MKLLLTIVFASLALAQPKLPFEDWKACPFETCGYREWTAREPAVVYDTWKQNRRAIARIAPGETVRGITGVVITYRPGVVRMDRDLPALALKRGDLILTYAYRGEGYWAAWWGGKYYPEFDLTFAKLPDGTGCGGDHCAATFQDRGRTVWRAEVKLRSGKTGWLDLRGPEFDYGK